MTHTLKSIKEEIDKIVNGISNISVSIKNEFIKGCGDHKEDTIILVKNNNEYQPLSWHELNKIQKGTFSNTDLKIRLWAIDKFLQL